MTRLIRAAAVSLALLGPGGAPVAAAVETRLALVIGNSAYSEAPLANPVNDARLMSQTLRELGFEVIERLDLDQKAMKIAIFEFGDRLEEAGKDAVGLFYYAGHGVQVDGDNYLIPLNATIEKERHVAVEAVSAAWVLGQMEFVGNRMNFVILDACRNNPLTRGFRSPTAGLARMDAPRGTLLAYSTSPGAVSLDGKGANSPYTEALARELKTPGIPVEQAFKRVRIAVMAQTNDKQVPWESSSLTGEFQFAPGDAREPSPQPVVAAAATDARPADGGAAERLFWETIQDSDDPAMFEEYLRTFPGGTFAGLARIKLDRLRRESEGEEVAVAGLRAVDAAPGWDEDGGVRDEPAPPPKHAAGALIDDIGALFDNGDLDGARAVAETFLETYPRHPRAPEVFLWLGEMYFVEEDFAHAAEVFADAYREFPHSDNAPEVLVQLSISLAHIGEERRACATLRKLRARVRTLPAEMKRDVRTLRRDLRCR